MIDALELNEFDNPSRADYYAMRVCQAVAIYSGNLKKGTKVDLNEFKLPFRPGAESRRYSTRPGLPQPLTKDQVVELRKKQDLARAAKAKPLSRPNGFNGRA